MRTRRSPRNQEILWRALGHVTKPAPVKRTKLRRNADVRREMFAQWKASGK